MTVTFIMGNGFDIGLGLHTGYECFYEEYCKFKSDDSENIRQFKTMLKERNNQNETKIIDWADFERAFGQHSEEFSFDEKSKYIERFEDFVYNFNRYLEDEEKLVDYSNENEIANTMDAAVTTYYHIRSGDKDAIQDIYNRVYSHQIYNFISFNYTKTVDRCAQILKDSLHGDNSRTVGKVIHIHGYVEENMIMGVNDPSQISNNEFANDTILANELVKPQQNESVHSNYEKQTLETINSSDIICIYGMSLGETDKKWWNIIANWLAKNNDHALVIMKYTKSFNRRFTFSQIGLTDKVINRFIDLAEPPSLIADSIRSQIFVGINHNVFQMNLRKKDPIIEHNKEKSSTEHRKEKLNAEHRKNKPTTEFGMNKSESHKQKTNDKTYLWGPRATEQAQNLLDIAPHYLSELEIPEDRLPAVLGNKK
ncbi:MAG: hypothetical protein IJ331_01030 [Ruminococcus sp.]|nr:hypothetical protein [Ruminococcus sp.]